MSNDQNGLASEYEMSREPRFYSDGLSLRTSIGQDHICDTCSKEDVCMYKAECTIASKEIMKISERTDVFIDAHIRCKKWISKMVYLTRGESV